MPSLKSYRDRIASVKSTRKITSAMKMVAASKLKRAQTQAQASQPYAAHMAAMLQRLVASIDVKQVNSPLVAGTGRDDVHLLIVMTSDRGLCGGFNGSVIRLARQTITALKGQGKTVKLLCVGRKGRDALRRQYAGDIIKSYEGIGRQKLSFSDADEITRDVLDLLAQEQFDVCTLICNQFKSVIAQIPAKQQLVPFALPDVSANDNAQAEKEGIKALYEFEPDEEQILSALLPRNLAVQIYRALLDSAAGEQAARMTAMDNATRNAGEMIGKLTLQYNRARQAYITKELIEIISGAEAV